MQTKWVLFGCVGKCLLFKGGKAVFNALGRHYGDVLFENLPEVATAVARCFRQHKDENAQVVEVQELASAPFSQVRQEAERAAQEVAADQSDQVKQTLAAYLSQIPATIRRSLRRPSDPNGKTVPAGLVLGKGEDLLRFLPARLPRFRPGDRPIPGVDLVVEELLGIGGFGEVWLARNPHLTHLLPVALKFCLDPTAAKVLRHEAGILDRVMSQGKHPGIVALQHTYLSADPPCLEYEYVEGGDLAGLMHEWQQSKGGPTPQEAMRVVYRVAEIVAFAHQQAPPIVHRDLKPANILVQRSADGKVRFRVADFGIGGVAADLTLKQGGKGTTRSEMLTAAVQGAYTPLYASPQQMRGDPPNPRDDIYALGVIWYQLLTGNPGEGAPGGLRWPKALLERGMTEAQVELLASCFEGQAEDCPADAAVLTKALAVQMNSTREKSANKATVPLPQQSGRTNVGKGSRTRLPEDTQVPPLRSREQPTGVGAELHQVRTLSLLKAILEGHRNVERAQHWSRPLTLCSAVALSLFGLLIAYMSGAIAFEVGQVNRDRNTGWMMGTIVCIVLGLVALAGPPWFLFTRKRRQLEEMQILVKDKIREFSQEYPEVLREWGGPRVLDDAATVQELIQRLEQRNPAHVSRVSRPV